MESERIPVNGAFTEQKNYKGAGWVLFTFGRLIIILLNSLCFRCNSETGGNSSVSDKESSSSKSSIPDKSTRNRGRRDLTRDHRVIS